MLVLKINYIRSFVANIQVIIAFLNRLSTLKYFDVNCNLCIVYAIKATLMVQKYDSQARAVL